MKAIDTWERVLIGLIVLVYVVFGLGIHGFLAPYAIADSTTNMSEKAIIALAMALLVVAGEIDLSIAATMALSSLAMGFAMKAGAGLTLMLLAAAATGAACGSLNGWLVTRWQLPSIVVTIGTLSLYRGLAQVLLGDQAITGYPDSLSNLGNGTLGDLLGAPRLIVPTMLPRPPSIATPPRMTMVTASSSQPIARFGRVLPMRPVSSTAASAAITPANTNSAKR